MMEQDNSKIVKVNGLGLIELELNLTLSTEEANLYSINFEEIQKIEDCQNFLKIEQKNLKLIDLIQLKSNNFLLNSLLFLNKSNKLKTFIEFVALHSVKLVKEAEFFEETIKYLTENNFLFIVENDLIGKSCSIKFNLKVNGELKTFELCNQEDVELEKKEDCGNNEDEINALVANLNYNFNETDYLFVDLKDFLKIKDFLKVLDFCEFLNFLAKKHKNLKIITNFPSFVKSVELLDIDFLTNLESILFNTDIFIFDKEQLKGMFDILDKVHGETPENPDEIIIKRKPELKFLTKIQKNKKKPKILIIFDDFHKFMIIEQDPETDLVLRHNEYLNDLVPLDLSKLRQEEYRKLLALNYDYLKSVFIGGLLSRLVNNLSFKASFISGNESVRRIMELLRFEQDYPNNPNYFIIPELTNTENPNQKINNNLANSMNNNYFSQKNKGSFQLDCVKFGYEHYSEYNPLRDKFLRNFFDSEKIKRHLKKLNFINNRGEILDDPDRKILGDIHNGKLLSSYYNTKKDLIKSKIIKEKIVNQLQEISKKTNPRINRERSVDLLANNSKITLNTLYSKSHLSFKKR